MQTKWEREPESELPEKMAGRPALLSARQAWAVLVARLSEGELVERGQERGQAKAREQELELESEPEPEQK
jgi:macrodomain Ter protein organizer (MatP/YcbG family)